MQTKRCSSCLMDKPLTEFWPDVRYRMGVKGQCRPCVKIAHKRLRTRIAEGRPEHPIEKICPTCKAVKSADAFSLCPSKRDGLSSRCKECRLKHERPKNHRQLGRWRSWLHKRYGLTLEEAKAIFDKQGEKCAVCERSLENGRHEIDHCHKTGKVRGILCPRCNRWLAALDSEVFMEQATRYLARFQNAR